MSLIHWWPLNKDGDYLDYGANCNNLTNHGCTFESSGKIGGYCLKALGTSSGYMDYGKTCSQEFTDNHSFSIAVWFKHSSRPSTRGTGILANNQYSNGGGFGLIIGSSGNIILFLNNSSTSEQSVGTEKVIPLNEWHHVAATYDGSTNKYSIYIDGKSEVSGTAQSWTVNSTTTLIGVGTQGGWSYGCNQFLNDLRVYDHALSQLEVSELAKGCVLHYDFEDPFMHDGENLITSLSAGGQTTIADGTVTTSGTDADTYFTINLSEDIICGDKYVLHCYGSGIPEGKYWQFPLGAQGNTSLSFQIYNGWNHYIFTANNISWGTKRLFMDDSGATARSTVHNAKFSNWSLSHYYETTKNLIADSNYQNWSSYGFGSKGTATMLSETGPHGEKVCRVTNKTTETYDSYTEWAHWHSGPALTKGDKISGSVYVRGVGNTIGKTAVVHIYNSNGTNTISNTCGWITLTASWQRVGGAITWTYDNSSSTNYSFYVVCNMMGGESFDFCNAQMEYGDHYTAYLLPQTSKNILCYDASGNNNNGIVNGDIQIISDSGRGEYDFINAKNTAFNYIDCNITTTYLITATIACWYKKKSAAEAMLLCSGEFSGNHYCMAMSGTSAFWGSTGTTYVDGIAATTPPQDTNWHYYVASGIDISSWPAIQLGHHSDTYTYHGECADFEIFNTALTATQVKTMYERKAAIGRNGCLMTDKVVEKETCDMTNLVWNGGPELKNNSGYNGDYSSTYNAIRWNSDAVTTELIEINRNDTYELNFDILYVSDSNDYVYFVVYTLDENKQFIDHYKVNHYSATETTLATALTNGATTATITSNGGWINENGTYRALLAFYRNDAFGYTKATSFTTYASVSGTTITLKSAWTGGTIPAGTKVAEAYHGSGYCYPWYKKVSDLTSGTWYHYSGNFTGNGFRYGTRYVRLGMIYSGEYYVKNLRLVNKSRLQLLQPSKSLKLTSCADKANCFNTYEINEIGMPIRYIRDSLNGSSANNSSHWVEIQAFNTAEENILYGKPDMNGTYTLTNEITTTTPYAENGSISDPNHSGYLYYQVDIGYITNIQYLKIWHYWGDSRAYNNITQVSTDGTNWITVFDSNVEGKYNETSAGHTIYLNESNCRIYPSGTTTTTELIEN